MDYPIGVWCSFVASLKTKEEREVATIGLMWELSGDTYCHHKENKIYFLPHGKSPSYVHSGARDVSKYQPILHYREFSPYANFITANFVTAVFQNYI